MTVPTPKRENDLDDADKLRLIRRLDGYCEKWESSEGPRRSDDRRGAKFFRDQMWEEGITPGRLQITANMGLSLFERVAADITRGAPEPMVEAVNPDDEDGARIAQGGLVTNWRHTRMQNRLKQGYLLSGFTRAIGCYSYWRQEAHEGIGDMDHRLIPGHRLIVDDRYLEVRDMEYIGFEEEMTRAKLIMLFPDKAEDIETAALSNVDQPIGLVRDPLQTNSSGPGSGAAVVDRLVAQANNYTQPPYSPTTSVRTPGRKGKTDPLSEKVKVRFLWIDDPTPMKVLRPKLRGGKQVYEVERDENGRIKLEHKGYEVVQTPVGPLYQPNLEPKTKVVLEEAIVRKYKRLRHCAYVQRDRILLWDVAWEGPCPVSILRDRLPIYGFHAKGSAQRLISLGVARNVLFSIIFERLKLSLGGTWMATPGSGLKRNKLIPEAGVVFFVNDLNTVKQFPIDTLDAAYFKLLDQIENEMAKLIHVSPIQQGMPAGRADSPATYEQLINQAGAPTVDRAQLVEGFISDWCEINLWYMQNFYTHEHMVEVEAADGSTSWTEASALAMRGDFSVTVETGSTMAHSRAQDFADAKEAAGLGFYALPMLGRVGRIRYWKQALKQKAAIMADPGKAWLLGAAGAPPAQNAKLVQTQGRRSHHSPTTGK